MIPETAAKQQTLESWKEIAAYLNREVRTVRKVRGRWRPAPAVT